MNLFRIILFFFAVYFIRRFWQLYKAMEQRGKELQAREEEQSTQKQTADGKVVEAEYKVVDR